MKTITIEKTRKPSKSYTLKSMAENIKKLKDFGYITEEEYHNMQIIYFNALDKHMKKEYEFNH